MKLYLLGVASIFALTAGAANAQTVPNGYAGIGYNYTDSSVKAVSSDGDGSESGKGHVITQSVTVDGAVALPVTALIGVQADLHYANVQDSSHFEGDNFGGHADETAATAHVFARTNQWLAGGFVGEESLGDNTFIGGGVEGQYYLNRITLQGSAGAATPVAAGYNEQKPFIWALRGQARYFVTDDFDVNVAANYLDASTPAFDNGDEYESYRGPQIWSVGVGAEYKVPHSPFAVLASYKHSQMTYSENDNYGEGDFEHSRATIDSDTVSVGVRWTFGGSLFDRDRHGASLDSVKELFGDLSETPSFGFDEGA
jgi:hypothetical protein